MNCRLKFDIGWTDLLWSAFGLPVGLRSVETAENTISKFWAERHTVTALSVRTLLDAILSESSSAGSSLIATGVNIQNVSDIIAAHEMELVSVDLEPETLSPPAGALLDAHTRTGACFCLVAQLFGATTAIPDAELLRERGVWIIEDAAQAFCGTTYKGDPAADVSLFSFGPIKRCTALGGAVGTFRSEDFARRVAKRLATYPQITNAEFRVRALKFLVLKWVSSPRPYGVLLSYLRVTRADLELSIGGAARSFGSQELMTAIRRSPPPRMIALLARRLAKAEAWESREDICKSFLLELPPTIAWPGARAERHEFGLLPLRSPDPDQAIAALRRAGFDATRGATSLRTLQPELTPQARKVMDEVVFVPNPATLSKRARLRLGKQINSLFQDGLFLSTNGES